MALPKRRASGPRAATARELAWAETAFAKASAFERLAAKARARGYTRWAEHLSQKATAYRWAAGQARQGLGVDTSGLDSLRQPRKEADE